MNVDVRVAFPEEQQRLQMMCAEWGYGTAFHLSDTVFLAERTHEGVGIVRRASEAGVFTLRTMLVSPAARGHGVGTKLLQAFVQALEGRECYCVPYRHLIPFYGYGGFRRIQSEEAPVFLQQRLTSYRLKGLDVVLLRRPPQKTL